MQDPVDGSDKETKSLDLVEKEHITKVLQQEKGHITKAAEILKISRACIYNKMKQYDITLEDLRSEKTNEAS